MPYSPAVASALSGASLRQLSHWRRKRDPLLMPEQERARGRVLYSYQDVVALRTVVYLRARKVSLQKVRKAVDSLRAMGETEHLSAYRLVSVGKDVVWRESSDDAVALTGQPGQKLLAQMVDILGEFDDGRGAVVRPLAEPEPGVVVDQGVRAGFPVITGTRVPYDLVASLLADGVEPERIRFIYPSVSADAARGALAFASRVEDGLRARTA